MLIMSQDGIGSINLRHAEKEREIINLRQE